MAAIRPETEIDRTQAALARHGLKLPLARGSVEIAVAREVAETEVAQRIVYVLVNELARMKGVVSAIHLAGVGEEPTLPGIPLRAAGFASGLSQLVESLNGPGSPLRSELVLGSCPDPHARVRVGEASGGGLRIAADSWRALTGGWSDEADWHAAAPYGSALAAGLAAAEIFKTLLSVNSVETPARKLEDLAYSLFNYGTGTEATIGPAVTALELTSTALAGCGAGGTAALDVLVMQPGLTGTIELIEPGSHKLSNINRYPFVTASDIHEGRHKLASAIGHLAVFAPALAVTVHARPWEQLAAHPFGLVVSAVDTIEARWAIQARAAPDATIIDAAVLGLLYSVLRVAPGGWCLECKHPYDPELALKQRAARWGEPLEIIRAWTIEERTVDAAMIGALAATQNRPVEDFAGLVGLPFSEAPRLTECGTTSMQTTVPSQAPVLPLATVPLGALLAAEITKHHLFPEAALNNWLAHDLLRSPARPRIARRAARPDCPRHS